MLKKKILTKRLLSLILMILVSSYIPLTVQAADDSEVIIESEDTEVESTVLPLLRGTFSYLSYGSMSLHNGGNGTCSLNATTFLSRSATATVNVTLQRKVTGIWVNYQSWSNTVTGSSAASVSATITVPTGYYYRLSGTYTAQQGTITESLSGTTTQLYFN